jgi:Spy/CpxP family protein refolding chaperone
MTRFAVVASRLSFVAALGLAGCSGGPGTSAPAPAAEAQAAEKTPTETAETPKHGPAGWFFRQVAALDLRDDQRVAVTALQETLHAEMTPHREAVRQAMLGLADAVELGKLDATKADEQKAQLLAAAAEVKASFATAINGVHDTLDAPQRVALVERLKEQHEGHAREGGPKHGLAKLAYAVGLTEAQQAAIADAFNEGLDELVPQRKARREQWEAKMKAMGEAFVTDDFDAADFDLADHTVEALTSGIQMASRAVDVSNRVLSEGQRRLAADWVRDKARAL